MAVAVQIERQSVLERFFSRLFFVDLEVLAYGVVCCLVFELDNVMLSTKQGFCVESGRLTRNAPDLT